MWSEADTEHESYKTLIPIRKLDRGRTLPTASATPYPVSNKAEGT